MDVSKQVRYNVELCFFMGMTVCVFPKRCHSHEHLDLLYHHLQTCCFFYFQIDGKDFEYCSSVWDQSALLCWTSSWILMQTTGYVRASWFAEFKFKRTNQKQFCRWRDFKAYWEWVFSDRTTVQLTKKSKCKSHIKSCQLYIYPLLLSRNCVTKGSQLTCYKLHQCLVRLLSSYKLIVWSQFDVLHTTPCLTHTLVAV